MKSRSINKPGRTPLRAALLAGATAFLLAAGSGPAWAGMMQYQLTASNISGYSTGNFGLITLTDGTGAAPTGNGIATGTVHVREQLNSSFYVKTGSANSLEFNLNNNPSLSSLTMTNLEFKNSTSTSSATDTLFAPSAPPSTSAVGGFGYAVSCTSANTPCVHGASTTHYTELSFDITVSGANGLSASDFTSNGSNNYFLSDIGIENTSPIATGYAYSDGSSGGNTTSTGLPEPGSLALLGTGLIGLGFAVRRRYRRD